MSTPLRMREALLIQPSRIAARVCDFRSENVRVARLRGVTLVVLRKQSGELLETTLEFRALFLVQWLMPKRLQQRFCCRDENEHIRSNRHIASYSFRALGTTWAAPCVCGAEARQAGPFLGLTSQGIMSR